MNGKYNAPSSAALGGFANYPFTVAYRVFAYRLGATVKIPNTPVFIDIADVGDRADLSSSGPSSSVHNELMLGVGTKF